MNDTADKSNPTPESVNECSALSWQPTRLMRIIERLFPSRTMHPPYREKELPKWGCTTTVRISVGWLDLLKLCITRRAVCVVSVNEYESGACDSTSTFLPRPPRRLDHVWKQ